MVNYLLDNNAVSHFFSGLFCETAMDFMAEVLDQQPVISVITEIEALSWVNPDKEKEEIVKAFIQDASILALTPAIVTQCVIIRRSRKMKTPDAITAATAIIHNLTLITSDDNFSNVQGLRIINPHLL